MVSKIYYIFVKFNRVLNYFIVFYCKNDINSTCWRD